MRDSNLERRAELRHSMNRMKYLAFLPLTTLLACASVSPPAAVTNTPATVVVPDDTFNVPNGHFSTMYSGALAPFASVTCDFAIEQPFFGSKCRPIVSIIFSEQARFAEDAKVVKVSAVRSSEDVPWLHEITAYYGEERETKVPIPVGNGEVVEPLSMIMTDDGYVWIVVGDDVDGASYLDVSAMKLAY